MLSTTNEWKNVLHQNTDEALPESDVNVVCYRDLLDTSTKTVTAIGNLASQSNSSTMIKQDTTMLIREEDFATFELNFWVLDGSKKCLESGDTVRQYMSADISDDNCEFSSDVGVQYSSSALFGGKQNHSIMFSPMTSNFATEIGVTYGTETEQTFTFDEQNYYQDIHFSSTPTPKTSIKLLIKSTNMPHRRARVTEWRLGHLFFLNKEDLISFSHSKTVSMNMKELPQNDLNVEFVDIEQNYNKENTQALYSNLFQTGYVFFVYYGYLINGEWEWLFADRMRLKTLTCDKDGLKDTLVCESVILLANEKWNKAIEQTTSDYYFSTLGTLAFFLRDLSSYIGDISGVYNTLHGNITKSHWSLALYQGAKTKINDFLQKPIRELLQETVAMMCGTIRKNPNDTWTVLDFVNSSGRYTQSVESYITQVDYISPLTCFSQPTIEEQIKYAKGTFVFAKFGSGQEDDKDATWYEVRDAHGGSVGVSAEKLRKSFTLITGGAEEFSTEQCIISSGDKESNYQTYLWCWNDDLPEHYLNYVASFDCGQILTVSDCLINPAWEVADFIQVQTEDNYKNYKGFLQKIEVNYDGSFKGNIELNIPYKWS